MHQEFGLVQPLWFPRQLAAVGLERRLNAQHESLAVQILRPFSSARFSHCTFQLYPGEFAPLPPTRVSRE